MTTAPETVELADDAVRGSHCGCSDLFGVIYCDPPWEYRFPRTRSEERDDYPTMKTADICALQVPAAKDCILYLWAITQKLPDALAVISAWGFRYKTSGVWDKSIPATGYWFRGQHEFLLVATRGNVKPPATNLRVGSVMRFPRGSHSSKPDRVRDLIAMWYPDKPKLEMFARPSTEMWPKHPGWATWGNELPNDVAMTPNS